MDVSLLLKIAGVGMLASVLCQVLKGSGKDEQAAYVTLGGIVIVLALARLLEGSELEGRDLYANALCVMLPISAVSCVRYALAGNLRVEGFGIYALPAIAGGVLGGILLGRVGATWLKRLFGALVIWSGVLLMIR